ncbi:hypothetical protein [Speluncibacter jeojiensis]|uniref:Uncharacterized protein n=1 Tax=Speluncibacter jeojiensis TaxID=2710754 RepID=A0A9X4RC74_9ACTN|nr:hypothetical protein [Corynebacteriales bacterium D3-21]
MFVARLATFYTSGAYALAAQTTCNSQTKLPLTPTRPGWPIAADGKTIQLPVGSYTFAWTFVPSQGGWQSDWALGVYTNKATTVSNGAGNSNTWKFTQTITVPAGTGAQLVATSGNSDYSTENAGDISVVVTKN